MAKKKNKKPKSHAERVSNLSPATRAKVEAKHLVLKQITTKNGHKKGVWVLADPKKTKSKVAVKPTSKPTAGGKPKQEKKPAPAKPKLKRVPPMNKSALPPQNGHTGAFSDPFANYLMVDAAFNAIGNTAKAVAADQRNIKEKINQFSQGNTADGQGVSSPPDTLGGDAVSGAAEAGDAVSGLADAGDAISGLGELFG